MSLETEAVLDRRRIRRLLTTWRVLAVAAGAVAVAALAYIALGAPGMAARNQIARITIDGVISEDRQQLELIKKIADAKHVKALVVVINSPGGTATGGEALFEALMRVAGSKPVVAQMGTVATSAAYMAALAADRIFARGNTITGSVGVIWQWPEVSALLEKLGIRMNAITSGPLKANPNPYTPLDAPGRAVVEEMVAESKRWFLSLVSNRRGIDTKGVKGLEDGRVYTGRDALDLKLIDEIGSDQEVLAWLQASRGIDKSLRVVDWRPRRPVEIGPFRLAVNAIGRALGIEAGPLAEMAQAIVDNPRVAGMRLDGLVAIWLPSEN